jgi:hypothetical protein
MAEYFEGALTVNEQQILARSYFLPSEIEEFNKATTVDGALQDLNFNAENFQSMIKNRVKRVELLKSMGWRRQRVQILIHSYYTGKRSKRSVFDMLQVESSPSARQRGESDFQIARRLMKQTRVMATMGRGYTKGLDPVMIPRNIPPAPNF